MSEKMPHIRLDDSVGARFAILPGDPARVERAAEYLSDAVDLGMSREYRAVKGIYKGVPVLLLSTGIGGPSAAIAVEELKRIGVDTVIRIGSAGSLKSGLSIGDLVLVSAAVRDDGTSRAYIDLSFPAVSDYGLLRSCERAVKDLGYPYRIGIARSHDTMYGPDNPRLYEKWSLTPVVASDMESAAVLTVSLMRGLRAASILNIVSPFKGDMNSSVARYSAGEETMLLGEKREIETALEAVRIHSMLS